MPVNADLADLNAAYRNFSASRTGKREELKLEKPRFRSRKDRRQAIRFTANARFQVLPNRKLRLPNVGDVPVRWSRPLPSEPSSVTVIKDSAGRYFASFVIEIVPDDLPETESVAGIDLGLRTWQCGTCGTRLDRDINAAMNVAKAAGLAVTARGAQERPEPVPVQRGEAGTHPKSPREAA